MTITVLYIDDEKSLLDVGRIFLERAGEIRVRTTFDPFKVLSILAQEQFDAIISDYEMPGLNGIDLLIAVRKEYPLLPFILFTGRGREEVVILAINHGADFYLQKGGDAKSQFAELEHKVKQAVSKRQAEQSLIVRNQELFEASSRYKAFIAASDTGAWEYDADSGYLWCSPEYLSLLGYEQEEVPEKQTLKEAWLDLLHPDDREDAYQHFLSYLTSPDGMYEQYFRMKHRDGHWVWIWSRGKTLPDADGRPTLVTVGTNIDVTERRVALFALQRDESRLQALLTLYHMIDEPLDSIASYAMEEAVHLTGSTIGYVAFLNEDESVLTMHAWSKTAMQECLISDKPVSYPVDSTGLWGECIRQRRPVITNDYAALDPHKKGISNGHVPLRRILNVPVFEGEKIVVVAGVGNKEDAYDSTDIRQLELLMSGMWTIIGRKRAEEEVQRNNEELQAAYEEISATEEELRANLDEIIRQERELSESLRDLADIINFLPDATFAIDTKGTVILWNRAMEEMTKIPADQMIGKNNYEYALPFYHKRRPILIDLILSRDPSGAERYPEIRKRDDSLISEILIPHFNDGRGAYLWFTACPLYDAQGHLKGAIESIRDITERKKAEDALKQDEFYLETLVHLYQMSSVSLQELLTYAIEKGVEITGSTIGYLAFVSEDETVLTMYAWSAASMKECTIQRKPQIYPLSSTGLWGEAVRQRRPVITNDYMAPNPLKKGYPEGHVPVLRHMNIPVFDNSRIVMVAGVGNKVSLYDDRDVHKLTLLMSGAWNVIKKNRAEEALQESEQKYRNIVEDQTEFICRFLPDGTHIFVNDAYCRYFGKKKEEIIGHRFRPTLHPLDRDRVKRELSSLTPDNPHIFIEERIIMPDGSICWQRWSDRAIFDEDGVLKEYQSVGRDITEQKLTEEKLAQANQKLNLLSRITRHDINNQLTALAGYAEMLLDTELDSRSRNFCEKILTAAGRISFMIRFTKDYEEMGIHTPAWQDIVGIVADAKRDAPLGNVRVIDDFPAGIEIYADPLITRVFYNLMDNAVQYGETITTIRFFTETKNDTLVLVCEDDGRGIVAENKERIFEKGFGKNTGLGLFLSREILGITGITLSETGEYGRGARFLMVIPATGWRTVK